MIDQYEIAERVVDAGYGSGAIGIYKSEVVKILQERVGGLCTDHKTFLYVRLTQLHKQHNLGGGNITSALTAFSALSVLSKVCYYINKPQRFRPIAGTSNFEVNETNAFCHLVKYLRDNGVDLGVEKKDSAGQKLIWNGFRNYLSHLGTVEEGKQSIAFEVQDDSTYDGSDIETAISVWSKLTPFDSDEDGRNWAVLIDVLFAKIEKVLLPFIVDIVIEYPVDDEQTARNLYKLVAARSDLP